MVRCRLAADVEELNGLAYANSKACALVTAKPGKTPSGINRRHGPVLTLETSSARYGANRSRKSFMMVNASVEACRV